MRKTIKTQNHLRALSTQQLLSLIGHAPEIHEIKKLSKKDRVFDRNTKKPRKDVFKIKVEKIKGKKIDKYFAKEKNEEKVKEAAKQLASVLAFLHKNGMGHNDFRRTNIRVSEDNGNVKVKVFDNETINLFNHDVELLRKKLSISGTKLSYGSIKNGKIKVTFERDFKPEHWEKMLKNTEPERKNKIIKILNKEYERELFDSPMNFRGKPIHEMKPKKFVKDLKEMKMKKEVITSWNGLNAHQTLAELGHAPRIKQIERLKRKVTLKCENLTKKQKEQFKKQAENGFYKLKVQHSKGTELSEYLNKQENKEKIQEIAKQLGSIIGFLHKKGFSHNDYTPDNILVEENNSKIKLKVIDNETTSKPGQPWGKIIETPEKIIFSANKPKKTEEDLKYLATEWVTKKHRNTFKKTIIKEYRREKKDPITKFRGKNIRERKPLKTRKPTPA